MFSDIHGRLSYGWILQPAIIGFPNLANYLQNIIRNKVPDGIKYVRECDEKRRLKSGYLPLTDKATHPAWSFSETNITAFTQEIHYI